MDADLSGVEIVFAQKLASGEPITRKRALETLKEWISEQSRIRPFQEQDMMRLCKGLHYVMWMQDKMILQEELADRISSLLLTFTSEIEKSLFLKCLLTCLSKEWHKVDRWRMDKFLMLMRRILRVLFVHLKNFGWKKSARALYWDVFKETTISSDIHFSDGLKFHFASIFLDELDNAGGLSKKQMNGCLSPFLELLSVKSISDYLFNSIIDEAFMTILHQRSEEIAVHMNGNGNVSEMKPNISFDYKSLGKKLLDVGKQSHITSARRKKLYNVAQKFDAASRGCDPLHFETPQPAINLTKQDILEAHERIQLFDEKVKEENVKYKEDLKKKRKRAHEEREKRKVEKELSDTIVKKIVKHSSKDSKLKKMTKGIKKHTKSISKKKRTKK